MKSLRLLLVVAAIALPAVALAQWQWIDKSGRKVFSDQPPPEDIPAANIVKQPGKSAAATPAPAAAAAVPAAATLPAVPKLSGKDKELEEKKKRAEAAEAEKRKAAEAQVQAQRADSCSRAKSAKANYDSGVRISRTNDKGEREILDDAQRAAEVKRVQDIIARDCSPG